MSVNTQENNSNRSEASAISVDSQDPHVELKVPEVVWYRHAGLRKLYLLMPILMLCATINGYDGSLLNGLQTMTPWQDYFGQPNGSTLGLFTAIVNIGAFSALFFSPYIADYFGRRLATAMGNIFLFIGVILQAIPQTNRGMFIGGRFLVGFGSNISIGAAPLLIGELAYPQHRGRLTTLYNTLWYVGSIIAAWTVYGTIKYTGNAAWRVPVSLQALMPLVQTLGVYLLPESPRWLCFKGRDEAALNVLLQYHIGQGVDEQFVRAEFSEIKETLRLERSFSDQGWTTLARTPGNRKRLLLIVLTSFFSQCSGNGLVSYYLHDILSSVGVTDPTSQSLFNGGLQIWSWVVSVAFCVGLVDRVGRKPLFLIAAIGMLVTFTVWTACSAVFAQTGNKAAGSAVLAMIFLFYGVAGFAWPGLTIAYCSEILPYSIRAKGLAVCLGVTAISGVLNQYINPIGLSSIAWKFYFVYIAIQIFEVACIWFLFVETKGPTLEEIAVLFDGPKAKVAARQDMNETTVFSVVDSVKETRVECHERV